MAHPYFDTLRYPWHRPEAVHLHEVLTQAQRIPQGIDTLYQRSAPNLPYLNLAGPPAIVWKEALENLSAAGALRAFCAVLQNEAKFQNATIQAAVQAVINAPPDVEQHLIVAEPARAQLHALLQQVEMSTDQWLQCYVESLPQPQRPEPGVATIPTRHNIVADLCERPLQTPGKRLPIFDFVERVALATQDHDDSLSAQLRHWVDRVAPTLPFALTAGDVAHSRRAIQAETRHGMHDDPQPSAARPVSYLDIELIPDLHNRNRDKQKLYSVEITLWNGHTQRAEPWYPDPNKDSAAQGGQGAPDENKPRSLAEIEALLDRLLSDERYIAQIPKEGELAFEFIVPFELLSAAVAHWKKSGARPRGATYGMNHPLVMRLYDRLALSTYDRRTLFPIWEARWQHFAQMAGHDACDHVRWLCVEDELDKNDPLALALQLSDEEQATCLGLEMPTQDDEIFNVLIDAGVPVALWLDPTVGEAPPALSLREAFAEIAGDAKMKDLPDLIQMARRKAARERPHIGHHLVLLWDSPARIPPKYKEEQKLQ